MHCDVLPGQVSICKQFSDLALLEAQILNVARKELIGPNPTAAQVRALKSTQQRMDALTTLIKAQIARGAKGGDAAHGFRGTG